MRRVLEILQGRWCVRRVRRLRAMPHGGLLVRGHNGFGGIRDIGWRCRVLEALPACLGRRRRSVRRTMTRRGCIAVLLRAVLDIPLRRIGDSR
jgi:hypothetical protein